MVGTCAHHLRRETAGVLTVTRRRILLLGKYVLKFTSVERPPVWARPFYFATGGGSFLLVIDFVVVEVDCVI